MSGIKRWVFLVLVVLAIVMRCSYLLAENKENMLAGRPWYEFPIYLFVLIVIAILGPIIQAIRTRRMRMDEILAEKKIVADGEAYTRMKDISSMLNQSTLEDVKNRMSKEEGWLFKNLLFLPGKFADIWISIRNNVNKAIRLEKKLGNARTEEETERLVTELSDRQQFNEKLAEDALVEIYKDIKTRARLQLIPFDEWLKKPHQKSTKIKTNITSNKWLWLQLASAFLSIVFLYGLVLIIDGTRFITFSGITLSLIGLVMMINAGFVLSPPKDNEKHKKLFISGHMINKRYIFGFAFIILGYALQITVLLK